MQRVVSEKGSDVKFVATKKLNTQITMFNETVIMLFTHRNTTWSGLTLTLTLTSSLHVSKGISTTEIGKNYILQELASLGMMWQAQQKRFLSRSSKVE